MSLDITPAIANHVLHFFNRDEGFTPGGFFSAFYELLAKADAENVNRLSEGFPRQVSAFLIARKSEEGINQLREIAKPKLMAL